MSYKELLIPKQERNHRRILVVTGENGVGKTTLIDKAIGGRLRRWRNPRGLEVVGVGDKLFDTLKLLEIPEPAELLTKDDIRNLDTPAINKGILLTLLSILVDSALTGKPIIMDAHVVSGDVSPLNFYCDINPINYLYVYADPEQRERWMQERGRKTSDEDRETAEQKLHTHLTHVADTAAATGSGLITIWNRKDNVRQNVRKIRSLIGEL